MLADHGGGWIDSTVLVAHKIPKSIYNFNYYSLSSLNGFNNIVSNGRWASFLQFAKKGCPIVCFAKKILFEYWKIFDCMFDYFLIDYIYLFAYKKFNWCRNLIDDIDKEFSSHLKCHEILNNIKSLNDFNSFKKMTESALFFKLSWKNEFKTEQKLIKFLQLYLE